MTLRDIPRTATDRVILAGRGFQVDIKDFASTTKALKHKRSYGCYEKWEVIRWTYKILGPEPQSLNRPENEISVNGDITLAPVLVDTTLVSHDIDYKYLIDPLHRNMGYELDLFKTVDVVNESFDDIEGPFIVAYNYRVTKAVKLLPLT